MNQDINPLFAPVFKAQAQKAEPAEQADGGWLRH
jgi:hypothetical protein